MKKASLPKVKSILWFTEVGKTDGVVVGGKGANLGELTQAGLPVPPGFIVTAQAYFKFLKNTGCDKKLKKLLEGLDTENSKDLQARAEKAQKIIMAAKLPASLAVEIKSAYAKLKKQTGDKKLYVAVRSSATAEDLADASFAGQQATYLNVLGENNVVRQTKACWASLFEARAIYYRVENDFDHLEVGIAVPIQKMVNSQKAGVMFTIDPTNNDMEHISIEAALGLGEVVVLGAQTPDRYLVDKKTLEITDKEINNQEWMLTRESGSSDTDNTNDLKKNSVKIPKNLQSAQKLKDEEILELAKIANRIEAHYKAPQDTEWAIDESGVYMVQSRPITTLDKQETRDLKQGTQMGDNGGGMSVADAEVILRGSGASMGLGSGPVKIIHSPSEIDKILEGDILVTEMTTPDYVPAMKRAAGIVTDEGGRTCHAAIVSRELGIPCVVGTKTATKDLQKENIITVDGSKGVVYRGKLAQKEAPQTTSNQVFGVSAESPVTATKIYVNLGEPELAEKIAERDVDGVGLLRAEFMIANIGVHPKKMIKDGKQEEFIEKLKTDLETFASAFYPRPIIYRATDFKTNEYRSLKGGEEFEFEEDNPMIGYRGAFRYLKDPESFAMELEAIRRVRENNNNLHIMVPFVRTVDEFRQVKKIIDDSGLTSDKDFKLYIMAEVPSVFFLIDQYCKMGIAGVSIGSNDLTQLTLGLDRDSQVLEELFDERNEAVMASIKHIIDVCKANGVACSICGQAPSVYPEVTEKLVEWGISSISVNPDMIEKTRHLVASVEEKLLLKGLSDLKIELNDLESKVNNFKE